MQRSLVDVAVGAEQSGQHAAQRRRAQTPDPRREPLGALDALGLHVRAVRGRHSVECTALGVDRRHRCGARGRRDDGVVGERDGVAHSLEVQRGGGVAVGGLAKRRKLLQVTQRGVRIDCIGAFGGDVSALAFARLCGDTSTSSSSTPSASMSSMSHSRRRRPRR
jgi:hypothetical protein